MRLPFPPREVWPWTSITIQPADWSRPKVVRSWGIFYARLGPVRVEINSTRYMTWLTDIVLPEGRMIREMGGWQVANEPGDPGYCSTCKGECRDED
jgi:hypothetical protein